MDLAQQLVRSVARTFFNSPDIDTRHVLIVDALIIHSALRDDDLSYLMSMNLKDLHRICAKLRDERLLQVYDSPVSHVRPELREGQQRPTNRTYYYIDYRQAIDAIKWRVYHLDKAVQGNAKPASEKKEYFCRRCRAEWTQMEVLDKVDPVRGFICHRCDDVLIFDPEREAGGHEQSTKLNNQLRFITDMLPKLDAMVVPENTFETAYAAARPVVRDATNQAAPSIVVESIAKPTAVKGMANTGPQSIAVDITELEGPTEAEKKAEQERKEKIAQSNALPAWHLQSTVTGASYGGANPLPTTKADDEDEKKPTDQVDDSMHSEEVSNLFEMLARQQAEEARRKEAEAEDSDEEDDGEDEDEEFEDITNNASSVGDKRLASSGTTSVADTPASEERPPKKVKVEVPADEADSDDEDVAFEDV
ncbi:TFIIE alpha subunit [Xylaria flabelliformis]|nr:TFIIE alpha subunit [Xylaria flabelliformis]